MVLINAFALAIGEVAKFQSWQAVLHYGAKPLSEGRLGDFQQVVKLSLLLDVLSAIAGVAIGVGGSLLAAKWLGWPPEAKPVRHALLRVDRLHGHRHPHRRAAAVRPVRHPVGPERRLVAGAGDRLGRRLHASAAG